MTCDRNLTASVLVSLIAKSLALNSYELKPDLSEVLFNLLSGKPLVSETEKTRISSSVKGEIKKHSTFYLFI